MPTHGYSTSFGYIPKSPSLRSLNFKEIEKQIKQNQQNQQITKTEGIKKSKSAQTLHW